MKTRYDLLLLLLLCQAVASQAGAIRNLTGFTATVYGPNDDGTYPVTGPDDGIPPGTPTTVPIGFSINFYGQTFNSLYVNNNGNVTFDGPLGDFTPFGLADTASQIIAPFFADVDTRAGNLVTFGNDTVEGHTAFGVNWIQVGYYETNVDKLDSFQLVIIDRSDRNAGDFDIEFNYDQIQWETGDASGGTDGLGGDSAVAGFSNGSGQPGTSFQLQGSAIPGELLDNNPGGLIHGDLNTNVPGRYVFPIVNLTNTVLDVQRFSQGDPRWAGQSYASSTFTIQQKGCALSSLAMALNYAGETEDPGFLNALMTTDGDFVGTAVNWDAATRDASGGTLEFHAFRTSDIQYLSQTLAQGYPVVVGVNLNDNGAPGHFVLVIGEQNGQFLINDPGHADATTLAYYNNDFETRGYVGDPAGDVSGLDASAGNLADIMVVDQAGRRTGYSPAAGMILQEIPQSVSFLDCIENSDLTGAPGTDTAHLVQIYQPMPGNYQVFLLGTSTGKTPFVVRSFSQNGTGAPPVTAQASVTSTAITPLQINFAYAGATAVPFTNQYAWSASPTNGVLPLNVQFSAPNTDLAGNLVTNWSWNFGDGSTSYEQNPSHLYTTGGHLFPSLTAIDTAGNTVVGLGQSFIIPTFPFTANPTLGPVPLTVHFAATNIDSEGNAVGDWIWDFGDGTGSTAQNPTHTYTAQGYFSPVVIGTNSIGQAVSGIGPYLSVLSPGVAFTASATNGAPPLLVLFNAANTDTVGNGITAWNWDFGDGYSSSLQNPSHTYTTIGMYSVNLTATNNLGDTIYGAGPASISVAYAPVYSGLVLNGGFETGDFTGWSLSGDGGDLGFDSLVDDGSYSGIFPHSGNFAAALGAFSSRGYLSQTLSTTAGASYLLSFWLENPYFDPADFRVSWNGTTLFDTNNINASSWAEMQFVVSASGAGSVLQFGFDDATDYLGLDGVSVVAAQPGISAFRLSGANLVLSGTNAQAGWKYYLLMSTNLSLPLNQWVPVTTNVLGASGNFSITATNAVNPNTPQGFYILETQ